MPDLTVTIELERGDLGEPWTATVDVGSPIWRSSAMTENYASAKAKTTTKPFAGAGPGFDRPGAECAFAHSGIYGEVGSDPEIENVRVI